MELAMLKDQELQVLNLLQLVQLLQLDLINIKLWHEIKKS
jgi:hypothetical protein